MVASAALLLWESRELTLLVDEWQWGYAARTGHDLQTFVDPHNGHFAAVMVLITKAALQVFDENAETALRVLAVALHLATAGCLFLLLRRSIGSLAALVPTILLLFLGAANDGIIGSHGMSVTITVLAGLTAWLAIQRHRPGWDMFAAAALTIGVATESTVLPFAAAAGVMIALDRESPRSRLWVALLPIAVYVLWWIAWGHEERSGLAIANLAAFPAYAFDSLAASLAAITGVFTIPGSRTTGFDLAAGQALAGGLLVTLLLLVLARRYRPGAASIIPFVALLLFWLSTAGVANPARVPWASRYLYIDVVLLLLVLAQEIAASPVRRRGALALSAVCALALLPNIREITYAGDAQRGQAEINRAVMGAANMVIGHGSESALLEDSASLLPGEVGDLGLSLAAYRAARERFGSPAMSPSQIADASGQARQAADSLLVRALPIVVEPASARTRPLPPGLDAAQTGGLLEHSDGCLRFIPLAPGAQVNLGIPVGGLWVRPAVGDPAPITVARFAPDAGTAIAAAIGGRPSVLTLPASPASSGWRAWFTVDQPLRICAAA